MNVKSMFSRDLALSSSIHSIRDGVSKNEQTKSYSFALPYRRHFANIYFFNLHLSIGKFFIYPCFCDKTISPEKLFVIVGLRT